MMFDKEIFVKKRVWVRVHVQVCSSEEANPFQTPKSRMF